MTQTKTDTLQGAMLKAALNDEDLASSEDEVVAARGSADEDDESVDEDFNASDSSDPEEEYNSAHESSGDDEEMADADGDQGSDREEVVERPKKKSKTGK